MARICTYCIMKYGIRGSEIDEQDLSNDEAFANHLEECHGLIVRREGETMAHATKRCAEKGIVTDRAKCGCRDCREKRTFKIPV